MTLNAGDTVVLVEARRYITPVIDSDSLANQEMLFAEPAYFNKDMIHRDNKKGKYVP